MDEGALKSVLYEAQKPLESAFEGAGYLNFVAANWKPMSQIKSELGIVGAEEEEVYEPIEGCTEEDVGWMRISSIHVGAGFYQVLMGWPDVWYIYYVRPPEVMIW